MAIFWSAVSVLYAILAVGNYWFSRRYSKRMAAGDGFGIYAVETDKGKRTIIGGSKPEGKLLLDYWGELKTYLDWTTALSVVGCLLAAGAAVICALA